MNLETLRNGLNNVSSCIRHTIPALVCTYCIKPSENHLKTIKNKQQINKKTPETSTVILYTKHDWYCSKSHRYVVVFVICQVFLHQQLLAIPKKNLNDPCNHLCNSNGDIRQY